MSPALAPLLAPDEWSRLMRCCTALRDAMRKSRPSMRELVVCDTREQSAMCTRWLAHGWPRPALLVLRLSSQCQIAGPPPLAAQWLARSLRGVRVVDTNHSSPALPDGACEWLEAAFQNGQGTLKTVSLEPWRKWPDPSDLRSGSIASGRCVGSQA